MNSTRRPIKATLLKPSALVPLMVALVAAIVAGSAAVAWRSASAATAKLESEQAELAEAIADKEWRLAELERRARETAELQTFLELLDRAAAECEAVSFDRRATLQADIQALPSDVQEAMGLECPDVFEWMIDGDGLAVDIFDSFSNTCEWGSRTTVNYGGVFANTSRGWTLDVMFEARIEDTNGNVLDRKPLKFVNVAPGDVVEWSAALDTTTHQEGTCVMDGATFFIWPSDF